MSGDGLQQSVEKMRGDGVHEPALTPFTPYYELLRAGERGVVAEAEIEPVESLPDADELPDAVGPLDEAVVIKLNGGLGTSMGMSAPKSLLEVKDGLSYLDLAARQVLDLRARHGVRLPLVLMNSFATRDATLAALERYPELDVGLPLDFVQSKIPKIDADALVPVRWERDPSLEWCPPGHGDLYTALLTSGMLDALLRAGHRYAFVSNIDNVGAAVDPRILAWFAGARMPFAMEAADRTLADRKGGHLAARNGRLVLREVAQTPEEDLPSFQDTDRHRYFNTNNLWVDLRALADVLNARDGVLGLPLIVNRKTVDPADKSSPAVFQLETAMGAAIEVFDGAGAIRVPRSRFAPTKTTSDLLVLRSDAYDLRDGAWMELAAAQPPVVDLDEDHFKLVDDFEAHLPHGAPSLRECASLTVRGDVVFGRDVVVRGDVRIEGPCRIEDGSVLQGDS